MLTIFKKLIYALVGSVLIVTGTSSANIIFQDSDFSTGWSNYRNGAVERSSNQAIIGTHSLRKMNNGDPNGGWKSLGTTVERNYTLEGWFYRPSTPRNGPEDRIAISDSNFNGYGLRITGTNVFIERRTDGNPVNLTSAVAWNRPNNQWYRFRFTANEDNTFTAKIFDTNGTEVVNLTSNANTTHTGPFDRVVIHGGSEYYVDGLSVSLAPQTQISLAQIPFEAGVQVDPNILLILDNSNSMVEDTTGAVAAVCDPGPGADCIAGSAAPTSKSETIRGVARSLVSDYAGRINLGLMAYQQFNATTSRNESPQSNVVRWDLVDRIYDVSYDPNNWDPDFQFDLNNWDSTTKRFRIPNPTSPGNFIHYNIGVPGYTSGTGSVNFCRTRESGNDFRFENFLFTCQPTKTGTSDNYSTNWTNNTGGYAGNAFWTTGSLNDSARARGVTHWGQRMVALPFNREEWLSSGSPGLGYLHVPIAPLDDEHQSWLNTKLGTVPYPATFSSDIVRDPDQPLINAGLTPIQGTLRTARDYWADRGARSGTHFRNAQGFGNSEEMPISCGADATIWLTDGMPSADMTGGVYGSDVTTALNDAVESANILRNEGETDLYVVGFSMPPTVSPTQLEQLAPPVDERPRSFLTENTAELNSALRQIFDTILADTELNSTSVALSSSFAGPDNDVFITEYSSSTWSGLIRSENFATGDINWDTNDTYPSRITNTPLYTVNTTTQTGLRLQTTTLDQLDAVQQAALNISPLNNTDDDLASSRVSWLLGENNLSEFRARQNALGDFLPMGDIVNSAPLFYSGNRYFGYDLLPGSEGSQYRNFSTNQRPQALFVGANDGKVHAINPENGHPLFAYLPGEFLKPALNRSSSAAQINSLMVNDYNHRYYVDGNLTYSDAYIDDNWQSVLLGTLGNGGRSVFALNITDVDNFDPVDHVMWEFSHPNLGYGVKDVNILRLPNGQWVAVFGNGYNSANNRAQLFVVELDTGNLIRIIDTGAGNASTPNGLASITSTDWPKLNLISTLSYAGDLLGNVWRFDLSSPDPDDWTSALIFTATDQDDKAQPITAPLHLSVHPNLDRTLVLSFGTGSYFKEGDNTNQDTQSFYGLFDQPLSQNFSTISRGQLVEQEVSNTGNLSGKEVRQVSQNEINLELDRGWFIDLPDSGERVVSQARTPLRGAASRIIFNTLISIQSDDICIPPTREGFIMALDPYSGARIEETIFDINDDGSFDSSDRLNNQSISGVRFGSGSQSQSAIGENTETLVAEDGEQITMQDSEGSGRISWQEIR